MSTSKEILQKLRAIRKRHQRLAKAVKVLAKALAKAQEVKNEKTKD